MKLKFIRVPTLDPASAERELNAFLASHRIVSLDREFVQAAQASAWVFCISYEGDANAAHSPERRTGSITRKS